MKEPTWLLQETVLAFQQQLIEDFGGAGGVRDEGLLLSALGRPENLFAYGKPTIFELAASYAFALVRNHPFIDGNKRIGFAAAALFLETNGYQFFAEEADAAMQTLALAARELDEPAYALWLKTNSRSKPK
jgi:death-on-curing protein